MSADGLVLIHGRGASAASMRPLADALGQGAATIAAPEAPGRSWWPTSFLAPMAQMAAPLETGLDRVETAIASLGLPRDRVVLVGFSQGACLALEYAARQGRGLGAVIASSGGLVGTDDAPGGPQEALYGHADKRFDYTVALAGLPVLITCHEANPHIPLGRARDSVAALAGQGAEARLIEHPGPGHQPMQDGIAAAQAILA